MNNTQSAKLEQPQPLTPDASQFQVMKETATMLVKTSFLPSSIKTAEQAMAIILTGRELGIGTMAALNTINVIQNKPTVSPQLMLALIERSGQLENIEITPNSDHVVCTMKRKGRSQHSERFGQAEAAALQLSGKDNYKKQAYTMYRWRAVAACARVVFPDVILGLYTPDEMGAAVNEDGEIVEALPLNVIELPSPKAEPTKAQAPPAEAKTTEESAAEEIAVAHLCSELNKAGDSITWNKKTLAEYVCDLCGVEAMADLTPEQWQSLAEDLQERLDALR